MDPWELLIYLRAVMRHWIASMSGLASLAVGTAVQWQWIQPTKGVLNPKLWWTIAAVCFAVAMFQAWRDEYKAKCRLEAERCGPQPILELSNDRPGDRRWLLSNSGADALNIRSEPIRYGRRYALFTIDKVTLRDGPKALVFDIYLEDGSLLLLGDVTLNHIFRAVLDDKSVPDAQFEEQMTIPVVFRYTDAFGKPFETECEIYWDLSANTGGVIHRRVRASPPAIPGYKRLVRKIFCR